MTPPEIPKLDNIMNELNWEKQIFFQVVTKAEFPAFFRQFVKDAEAVTKTKYKMRFANIIHRTVSERLDELMMKNNFFFRSTMWHSRQQSGLWTAMTGASTSTLPKGASWYGTWLPQNLDCRTKIIERTQNI